MKGAQLVRLSRKHVDAALRPQDDQGEHFPACILFVDLEKVDIVEDSDERILLEPRPEEATGGTPE